MYRCTAILLMLSWAGNLPADPWTLHVSPTGRATASGSESDPFASLEQARDRIRLMRQQSDLDHASVQVLVHSARYELPATLVFTAEDSGTEDFPITYRAVDGEVQLSGGLQLREWHKPSRPEQIEPIPLPAREHVVCVELSPLGVSCGNLNSCRLHQTILPAPLELFANQTRLPRAGWPNQGWALAKPTSSNSWHLEHPIHPKDQAHAWALGFWETDWNSALEPVSIDRESSVLAFSSQEPSRSKKVRDGARYRLTNLLCELDQPGEWFVETTSNTLYYWPVETSGPASISVLDTVVSIYDTSFLTLDGFHIEDARSMGVEIAGGNHVCLRNCRIGQTGTVGVHLFGGYDHRIESCEVASTGSSAIRIEAGDRSTLERCDHIVKNCSIHDFCQHFLGGRPAVALYGVGIELSTNHIHRGPDLAIAIHGNEHLIQHNEIGNVCLETEDSAAIHLALDPTYRGNIVRKNYIHDLGGFSKTGIVGIYLDDFASGTVVENNLLVNTVRGIAIGGGRDNRVERNIIVNSIAPIQVDARGLTWASDQIAAEDSRIVKLCKSALDPSSIYRERYPELQSFLGSERAMPQGNIVRANTFDGARGIELHGIADQMVLVENNQRVRADRLAETESNLRRLGIGLLAFEQTDQIQKPNAASKYVGLVE